MSLNILSDGGLTQTQVQSLINAALPAPWQQTPASESTAGTQGATTQYAMGNHSHPRLSSVTEGALGATGFSGNMMFTRSFAQKPGVVCTADMPGGSQPIVFDVNSWIQDANGNYTGCVIRGWRALTPTLTAVSVVGVSVAVGAQTITVFTNVAASGVNFFLIAFQMST